MGDVFLSERCLKCGHRHCNCRCHKECKIYEQKVVIDGISNIFSPAFGNFYQTNFVTLVNNQPVPWNSIGQISGGINLDPDRVTIHVVQAGSYYIEYYVSVNYNPVDPGGDRDLGLFINEMEIPNNQTRFGITNNEADRNVCATVSGGSIVFIPANATVQLRNVLGTVINTCDNRKLAASINLIKLS